MAPEYGATCGIFPVDDETLRYLRFTAAPTRRSQLVEAYFKEQGLFHTKDTPEAAYSDTLELDLAKVEACLAGPTRPQDRVRLGDVKKSIHDLVNAMLAEEPAAPAPNGVERLKSEGGGGTAVGSADR